MPVTPREGRGTSRPHRGPAEQHAGSTPSGVLPPASWVGATVGLSPHLSRGTGDKQSRAWPAFPRPLDR